MRRTSQTEAARCEERVSHLKSRYIRRLSNEIVNDGPFYIPNYRAAQMVKR